jgi:DNA polymerase/3'-5' exonuclease PolX
MIIAILNIFFFVNPRVGAVQDRHRVTYILPYYPTGSEDSWIRCTEKKKKLKLTHFGIPKSGAVQGDTGSHIVYLFYTDRY